MTSSGGPATEGPDPFPDRPLTEAPSIEAGPTEHEPDIAVGVGPHPRPWPDDPRYDPDLLAVGDRRNVVDRYRYWSVDAIRADLDKHRHPFHVVIENWQHDLNIGTVVRTANAFLAAEVHIVGRRRWNRRGAMVTDRYQHIRHVPSPGDLARWATEASMPLIGIDNLPGSRPLGSAPLPRRCALVFGQEGPGLSEAMRAVLDDCRSIPQFGSTRSINAGVAAGIAMYAWICEHGPEPTGPEPTGPGPIGPGR